MNKYELDAIKNGNIEFFIEEYSHYSLRQKEEILQESIVRDKLNIVQFFMDRGVTLAPHLFRYCLETLAEKRNKVKIFEYLHSKGVDLGPSGSVAVLRASTSGQVENTKYLMQFLEPDHKGIYLCLNCIVKRDNYKEKENPLEEFEPILNILLQKCSSDLLHKLFAVKGHSSKDDENNKYVLGLHLKLQLSQEKKSQRRAKI